METEDVSNQVTDNTSPHRAPRTFINRIGTAVPEHEVHGAFTEWAEARIADSRRLALFTRMAGRSGIERRWSVLPASAFQPDAFYNEARDPTTADRMVRYASDAPALALDAVAALGDVSGITHIVVASCTGFVAPGIDQLIARRLELNEAVERTLIGFMGCYAAVTALRTAHHIVRSKPEARVLVITIELCTLHLQRVADIDRLLAMLLFGDGAGAAIVSAEPSGLEIVDPFSVALADSQDLITWTVGDHGFAMVLSGEVPIRIGSSLSDPHVAARVMGGDRLVDSWAVHAGGRSILDAVEGGLHLPQGSLADSRAVLADYGNMSSSTLMFVLKRILDRGERIEHGRAIAFGPGLAAEGFGYRQAA